MQQLLNQAAAPEIPQLPADWIESSTLEDDAVPGENDDRAFEKFDHVVEVHYGYQIDPKDTTLPDGDSVDNNQYTRYLLDNYNIKVVCDWTAGNTADFQQKVSLAIASASLPDAVIAPTRNYLVQAARADLLADLWPEFNQYASKQVKEIIETTEGRAINNATVDGTFCARRTYRRYRRCLPVFHPSGLAGQVRTGSSEDS